MDERNNDFDFDFMPIGQAIKKAREARGMTREQLSGIIGYAPRHIQSIENEGKYPSIELFIQLITMFDVSVDEYIFPNKEVKKSSVRRRIRYIWSLVMYSGYCCKISLQYFSVIITYTSLRFLVNSRRKV